ncbi:hypothetical protein D3C72_886290 [compost metagenome]
MDHVRRCGRLAGATRAMTLDAALHNAAQEGMAPLSWENLSAAATLVVTPTGAPIRTIITGRRHVTTGVYVSRKAGRALPYESMNERTFFMHSEVDTEVVDYRAQPFRLEFILDGRKRTYTVDCVRLLADGLIELVEIKNDRRSLRDLDYASKLEAVQTICDRVGWGFRIVFKSSLFEPTHVYRNICDVQSWRLTEYTKTDVFEVAEQIHGAGPMPLARISEHLGDLVVVAAKLKAMMVGRVVRLDLSRPLNSDTSVSLLSPQSESQQ